MIHDKYQAQKKPQKTPQKKTAETVILNSPIPKKSLGEWPFCFVIRFMHKVGEGPRGGGAVCGLETKKE